MTSKFFHNLLPGKIGLILPLFSLLLMTGCPQMVDMSTTTTDEPAKSAPEPDPESPVVPIIPFKLPDQKIMMGSDIYFDISSLIPSGITITVDQSPSWLSFDSDFNVFSGTAPYQSSKTKVRGTYGDGERRSAKWSFNLIVGDLNLNIMGQTAIIGIFYEYDLTGVVGQAYPTITSKPTWLSYNAISKTFSGTPSGNARVETVSGFYTGADNAIYHWSFDISVIDSDSIGGPAPTFRVPSLNYTWGEEINLLLSDYFSNLTAGLRIAVNNKPSWLRFNPSTLRLQGTVPEVFDTINVSGTVEGHSRGTIEWEFSISIATDRKAYLWLTENTYYGNMEGLSGADRKCQGTDIPSELPKGLTHRAVLSTFSNDPASMLGEKYAKIPVYRPDGTTKITDDWESFFDDSVTATNSITGESVQYWTGAGAEIEAEGSCRRWTYSQSNQSTKVGAADATNNDRWSLATSATCDLQKHILCVSY